MPRPGWIWLRVTAVYVKHLQEQAASRFAGAPPWLPMAELLGNVGEGFRGVGLRSHLYFPEPHPAPGGDPAEELPRQRRELRGLPACVPQHADEYVVGEQAHVLGENAEHEAVPEVGHLLRFVALVPERLREPRKGSVPLVPSASAWLRPARVAPGRTSPA